MRVWMLEAAVVAAALLPAVILKRSVWEGVAALGVLFGFMHNQIADRHAEAAALREQCGDVPAVSCWRWSRRYFAAKELAWVAYFVHLRAWSALVGCALFLLYPIWRNYYRSRGVIR